MKKLSGISGFLLAYNEEENIKKSVLALVNALKKSASKYEVLVVLYEASTDNTCSIVKTLAKKNKHIRLVIQKNNRSGYGNAIKIGIENSKQPYVFFSDADNQFNMGDITKLTAFAPRFDIITGYRIDRKDPFIRRFTAGVYNIILRIIFRISVRDIDCAFKLFRRDIFSRMKLSCSTGMINTEIITKAGRMGYRIKEVGVPHFKRFAGRPTFETDKWAMIKPKVVIDLIKEMKTVWNDLQN